MSYTKSRTTLALLEAAAAIMIARVASLPPFSGGLRSILAEGLAEGLAGAG